MMIVGIQIDTINGIWPFLPIAIDKSERKMNCNTSYYSKNIYIKLLNLVFKFRVKSRNAYH